MKKISAAILLLSLIAITSLLWQNRQPGPVKPSRIVAVSFTSVDRITFAGFKKGLSRLGYGQSGQQVDYFFLSANGDSTLLPEIVDQALSLQPDLIFVSSTPATQAVARATREKPVPVVFGPVNDPVAAGIVPSIKQPSGHITGIRLSPSDSRRLQHFSEISPASRRLFLPYHGDDKSAVDSRNQAMAAADKLGLEVITRELYSVEELSQAVHNPPAEADAIFLPRDSRVEAEITAWVELSLRQKIPLCVPSRQQVAHGALFSYGFSHQRIGEQAARLASQILKGADPGSLPVEAAENFSYLNIKTAQAIGLPLSDATLRQINEIIRD